VGHLLPELLLSPQICRPIRDKEISGRLNGVETCGGGGLEENKNLESIKEPYLKGCRRGNGRKRGRLPKKMRTPLKRRRKELRMQEHRGVKGTQKVNRERGQSLDFTLWRSCRKVF